MNIAVIVRPQRGSIARQQETRSYRLWLDKQKQVVMRTELLEA
jgi:hypothetical protein